MPTFTIVGGVNGAGKSSLSGVLKDCLDDLGVIVDPDRLTAQHGGDEYAGGQAAGQCRRQSICRRFGGCSSGYKVHGYTLSHRLGTRNSWI